ncbi:DUF3108 domain-containing protein [Aquabacter spiritensis]|uniref:Uncharacterized protein DUF3108 n=1 Tax=Aquabacter spiritensis TaxID=933073 RepID=A0A4R3M1Y2_9HYPH|nr:DUF3108 domain-containing protein [Aquabacter spiritensis]TCT05187.1 uncharacterized protein DUF3108 [Aquabacter spiritensis]
MAARFAFLGWSSARLSAGAAALVALAAPALADGALTAKYALSVAGIEVGRASLIVRTTGASYEMAGTGRVSGILRAVSSGKGSAAARGTLVGGRPAPQVFAANTQADGKDEAIRIGFSGPMIKELDVAPPTKPLPDRVELTEAHKINVIDPMTGAFVVVPPGADPLSEAACTKAIPIFDGRQRFDVTLSFVRMDNVEAEKGYSGKAVVCRVGYVPVAGHRPARSTVKYMQANKDMYVWLVPIPGTGLMAPFKISIATMIGTAILEATSFELAPQTATVPVSTPTR